MNLNKFRQCQKEIVKTASDLDILRNPLLRVADTVQVEQKLPLSNAPLSVDLDCCLVFGKIVIFW